MEMSAITEQQTTTAKVKMEDGSVEEQLERPLLLKKMKKSVSSPKKIIENIVSTSDKEIAADIVENAAEYSNGSYNIVQ